jgi:hypothetical protein
MTDTSLEPRAAYAPYPTPIGRGRYRVSLHRRSWTLTSNANNTIITELGGARSRRLEQTLNGAATFTFSLDGRSAAAREIAELQQDVWVWRWDERQGADWPVFRGIVAQTEDVISEQVHTLNVTCHDYRAVMVRRYFPAPRNWVNVNQDTLTQYLLNAATSEMTTGSGTTLYPGSFLPLVISMRNPDGSSRPSGQGVPVRTRNYAAGASIGQMFDELAHVIGGFDYDLTMVAAISSDGRDILNVYFPSQGVTRTDVVLEYGGAVAGVTRSVNSADYSNYIRLIGNNGSADPTAAQLYSEAWTSDANNIGTTAVGLWQDSQNAADVSDQATLDQQVQGALNLASVLMPSYSLTLTPGAYYRGFINMGDTVPLVIRSGRLNIPGTGLRVVGLTFDITDDDTEVVGLTVGRPLTSVRDMLTAAAADINALSRR